MNDEIIENYLTAIETDTQNAYYHAETFLMILPKSWRNRFQELYHHHRCVCLTKSERAQFLFETQEKRERFYKRYDFAIDPKAPATAKLFQKAKTFDEIRQLAPFNWKEHLKKMKQHFRSLYHRVSTDGVNTVWQNYKKQKWNWEDEESEEFSPSFRLTAEGETAVHMLWSWNFETTRIPRILRSVETKRYVHLDQAEQDENEKFTTLIFSSISKDRVEEILKNNPKKFSRKASAPPVAEKPKPKPNPRGKRRLLTKPPPSPKIQQKRDNPPPRKKRRLDTDNDSDNQVEKTAASFRPKRDLTPKKGKVREQSTGSVKRSAAFYRKKRRKPSLKGSMYRQEVSPRRNRNLWNREMDQALAKGSIFCRSNLDRIDWVEIQSKYSCLQDVTNTMCQKRWTRIQHDPEIMDFKENLKKKRHDETESEESESDSTPL